MELNVSQKQERVKVALITAVVVFIAIFLTVGWMMSTVYGAETNTGRDEDGDKLEYNDCPGYNDGIDPSEYTSMSIPELAKITDDVDARIVELFMLGTSISEDEAEELNCLQAIRQIENNAEKEIGEIADDFGKLADMYGKQMELNEEFEEFSKKYD